MRRALALILLVLATSAVASDRTTTTRLLKSAWPQRTSAPITELGRGVAIIFSPDLSVPGNCSFYTSLGFTCFEEADWNRVLDGITAHNLQPDAIAINTVILETHGTNGNGLKLQRGHDLYDERSYISIGALQERLAEAGARNAIVSACNSGRLLRKHIVRSIDRENGDPLFLPATCGILDASQSWSPKRRPVTIIAPSVSHVESTIVARIDELPRAVADALRAESVRTGRLLPEEFAISDMLMQIISDSPYLRLNVATPVEKLSRTRSEQSVSETLLARFLATLDKRAKKANAKTAVASLRAR
jgi:hypothetical protein